MKFVLFIAVFCVAAAWIVSADEPKLTEAQQALAQKLAGTYWSWPDRRPRANYNPEEVGWFRLNADGTAKAGWNGKPHHWKPIDASTIEFEITIGWSGTHYIRFNPALTEATQADHPFPANLFGSNAVFHRLAEPESVAAANHPAPAAPTVVAVPGTPPAPDASPASSAPAFGSRIDELIERKGVIVDDLFGPLDKEVPPSIRDYLADLRENLLDEAARKPVASKQAYDMGARFCNGLISAYDEREQMAARLRNNAPTGAAGVPTTMKTQPNWIDYLREREQAAAMSHNNTIETTFAKMNNLQWHTRALQLRQALDAFYGQFRAAARQPVTAAVKSP